MSELTIKIKDLVHRQKEQLSHMNYNENDDELYCGDNYDMIRYIHKSKWTKKHCDMYISKQVYVYKFICSNNAVSKRFPF